VHENDSQPDSYYAGEVATLEDRRLRADAARNAERIVAAARKVYAEDGPDASTGAIASSAGVAERTLYRRFPTKKDLLRAALDSVADDLTPAIEKAHKNRNPVRGIADLLEAAISLAAQEHNILAAARRLGPLTNDFPAHLYETLCDLTRRAQRAGLINTDIVAEDLPRIIAMLHSVLPTMDTTSDGWRRYVTFILNAMTTAKPSELPPASPISYTPHPETWPT
jgi:AcrR family transcriptional regulator